MKKKRLDKVIPRADMSVIIKCEECKYHVKNKFDDICDKCDCNLSQFSPKHREMTMNYEQEFEKETGHSIYRTDEYSLNEYTEEFVEWLKARISSTARQAFIEGGTEVFLKWVDRSPLDSQIDSLKIFLSTKYDKLHKEGK